MLLDKPTIGRKLVNGDYVKLSDITTRHVSVNTTINLACEAEGNPLPEFIWYHSGKNNKFEVKNEINLSTVTVSFININFVARWVLKGTVDPDDYGISPRRMDQLVA